MKHSIKKIFSNLSIFLIIITVTVGVMLLLVLEENNAYKKINNLKNQKNIINSISNSNREDIELAIIQLNGKSNQLQYEIDKLRNLEKLDLTGKLLGESDAFLSDLNKLSNLTMSFNKYAHNYYTKNLKNEEDIDKELKSSFHAINKFLNSMIFKSISSVEAKFHILKIVTFFAFLLVLLTTAIYRKKLNYIYKDILHLYSIEKNKKDYEIFSEEVDAIQLRMGRKAVISDNPAMLDPVTQINNFKGMLSSYSSKKGMKESNFTSVTILEINNFSKQKRTFSQEFTQTVLKKVAFAVSLHEQGTDVIARTDYNQFTIILSRVSKEQSFKDIDIIRQSIAEIKFKEPGGGPLSITVSGGFVIKPNNQHLEEALRNAKEVLQHAKTTGQNSIAQIRDLAEHEL